MKISPLRTHFRANAKDFPTDGRRQQTYFIKMMQKNYSSDWPGAFETMHDSPISSRDISTFITRVSIFFLYEQQHFSQDDTEIFAKLDPLGTEQIRILDDFLSQMPEKVKPEDLSFVVDYSSFPQKMSNRPLETTGPSSGRPKDFRPIILGIFTVFPFPKVFLRWMWSGLCIRPQICPQMVRKN